MRMFHLEGRLLRSRCGRCMLFETTGRSIHPRCAAGRSASWSPVKFLPFRPPKMYCSFFADKGLLVCFVAQNSPAQNAGVLEGDRILSLNGSSTDTLSEVSFHDWRKGGKTPERHTQNVKRAFLNSLTKCCGLRAKARSYRQRFFEERKESRK